MCIFWKKFLKRTGSTYKKSFKHGFNFPPDLAFQLFIVQWCALAQLSHWSLYSSLPQSYTFFSKAPGYEAACNQCHWKVRHLDWKVILLAIAEITCKIRLPHFNVAARAGNVSNTIQHETKSNKMPILAYQHWTGGLCYNLSLTGPCILSLIVGFSHFVWNAQKY
jgi:hypothetical protein